MGMVYKTAIYIIGRTKSRAAGQSLFDKQTTVSSHEAVVSPWKPIKARPQTAPTSHREPPRCNRAAPSCARSASASRASAALSAASAPRSSSSRRHRSPPPRR